MAGFAVPRPKVVLIVVAVAGAGGLGGALTLETSAGTHTVVDEDSREFQVTESSGMTSA